MKKTLYINGENCGLIGKPVFEDSSGNQLYIGDITTVIGTNHMSINLVTKNCLYSWGSDTRNGVFDNVIVQKIVNYTNLENVLNDKKYVNHIGHSIEIKNHITKEMTMAEIEKELGYSIKIIKEN